MKIKKQIAVMYGTMCAGIAIMFTAYQSAFHHRMNVIESNQLLIIAKLNKMDQESAALLKKQEEMELEIKNLKNAE